MGTDIRTYSKNEALVQERRQHITACAINVFLRKGYRGTTIRELARECGMSEGAIYRYIGSKDDILHLLCLQRSRGAERLSEILQSHGNSNTTEILKATLVYHFQVGDKSRDYNLFFNREIRHFSHEDRQILLDSQVSILEFFVKLVQRGIDSGEFKTTSPILVAHNILMAGHDWGLRRWFLIQHFTLEEYTTFQTENLLRQLGVDTTATIPVKGYAEIKNIGEHTEGYGLRGAPAVMTEGKCTGGLVGRDT